MIQNFSKNQIATAIAILFHAIGLIGILIFENETILRSTPFNLLLSLVLLIWTQQEKNTAFFLFIVSVFALGFAAEVTGVHTAYLFGSYLYGNTLGPQWKQVPIIIGINWVLIIYCCGISVTALLQKITQAGTDIVQPSNTIKTLSVITDGATLAVIFDWIMEPVAVKLNFWQWENNLIPSYNYICWFFLSLLMMIFFHFSGFKKQNKFAVNLLLIQFLFFLILRTFIN